MIRSDIPGRARYNQEVLIFMIKIIATLALLSFIVSAYLAVIVDILSILLLSQARVLVIRQKKVILSAWK